MKRFFRLWLCVAVIACTVDRTRAADAPVILISLDGFRWDYTKLFPAESATLRVLSDEGAGSRALIPVFPSNTFPNHYSIVTGLYPAHHGIINNDFFDPKLEAVFRYNQPGAASDSRWWGGEPIWVTAIKKDALPGEDPSSVAYWVPGQSTASRNISAYWRRPIW